jgi:signal recognition particle subunit SRP54
MAGAKKAAKGQQRKKGKSGNPAKRAQEEKAAAVRSAGARMASAKSAFGMPDAPAAGAEQDPTDQASLDLPKGFENFLGK